jgi:hypothetical protein
VGGRICGRSSASCTVTNGVVNRKPWLLALVVWPAVGALWVVGALQVEVPDALVAAVILGVCPVVGPIIATALVARTRGVSVGATVMLCAGTALMTLVLVWLSVGVSLELGSDSDSSCPERRLYC